MATPQTRNKVIPLVRRGDGKKNVFDEKAMNTLIDVSGAAKDHPYTVFSIIGPQSSGKSTLMNGIFNTEFEVMDASKEWGRTTMGIWASICNNSRALVLDVEGTDSEDNQNDLGFDVRSGLYALLISNVIIFNIDKAEVRRANSNPLLTKIFQEVVKKVGLDGLPEQNETKFVVAVRNYNEETPAKKMVEIITSKINKIWNSISQTEISKLQNYFKLHVELIPDYDHEKARFNKKCEEIRGRIACGNLGNKRLPRLQVFPSHASGLWKTIDENKKLDLPSHMETMARTNCAYIVSEKLEHFKSKGYCKLTHVGHDNPREFVNQLEWILNDLLSKYKIATRLDQKYAEEEEKILKREVLHHAKGEFSSVMTRFENKIRENTKTGIDLECKKCNSGCEERIHSVVNKNVKDYLLQTEGITLYKVNNGKFRDELDMIGEKRITGLKKAEAEKEKAEAEKEKAKAEKSLRITKGVCIGVASVATAVATVATGPIGLLVGGTAAAVTAGTAAVVAIAGTGAAAAISASQGQPYNNPTVVPVPQEDMHGKTEDKMV